MKGKKVFTRQKADEIIELIGQKLKSDTNQYLFWKQAQQSEQQVELIMREVLGV